jgi:hypothetical protein
VSAKRKHGGHSVALSAIQALAHFAAEEHNHHPMRWPTAMLATCMPTEYVQNLAVQRKKRKIPERSPIGGVVGRGKAHQRLYAKASEAKGKTPAMLMHSHLKPIRTIFSHGLLNTPDRLIFIMPSIFAHMNTMRGDVSRALF